jgi:hypothetical protein
MRIESIHDQGILLYILSDNDQYLPVFFKRESEHPRGRRRHYRRTFDNQRQNRADKLFKDGRGERPHSKRGTKNKPTDFKRAYVVSNVRHKTKDIKLKPTIHKKKIEES